MFNLSMPEIGLILVIALVVFGPGKLPELGKALGRGIQEFKKATSETAQVQTHVNEKLVDKKEAGE